MADDEGGSVRMRGNLYARPDYFQTDVTRGVTLTPGGSRSCALSEDFLLGSKVALLFDNHGAETDAVNAHACGAQVTGKAARIKERKVVRAPRGA